METAFFGAGAPAFDATFDSISVPGRTTVKGSLPDGWTTEGLALVCVPYGAPAWVADFSGLSATAPTSDFGQRGYVYLASKTGDAQQNTQIVTYRKEASANAR